MPVGPAGRQPGPYSSASAAATLLASRTTRGSTDHSTSKRRTSGPAFGPASWAGSCPGICTAVMHAGKSAASHTTSHSRLSGASGGRSTSTRRPDRADAGRDSWANATVERRRARELDPSIAGCAEVILVLEPAEQERASSAGTALVLDGPAERDEARFGEDLGSKLRVAPPHLGEDGPGGVRLRADGADRGTERHALAAATEQLEHGVHVRLGVATVTTRLTDRPGKSAARLPATQGRSGYPSAVSEIADRQQVAGRGAHDQDPISTRCVDFICTRCVS